VGGAAFTAAEDGRDAIGCVAMIAGFEPAGTAITPVGGDGMIRGPVGAGGAAL
jgi:hypothetical protein